jgi:nicotinate dehydrogenase subunit B
MLMKTDHSTVIPNLTRRGFVKMGGALMVSFTFPGLSTIGAEAQPETTHLASWLEIRHDNTILVRTGRTEIGTGMSAFYAQVIAEELSVQPESITLLMGDTDKTPDGGYSAGFLSGAANLRKVGAYTYQALLGLAADKLRVPLSSLTVTDGIISGGGKSIRYGELVQDQRLDLKIPVSGAPAKVDPAEWNGLAGLDGLTVLGDPPTKTVSQYKVIGKSHPMPGIPAKVTGKTRWSCDVTLPGMLHARMVRPATLGSTLISVGALDKTRFPNTQVITKRNLVAVLSPNEWEAVSAARSVASATKWSEWSGLPGSDNLTQTLRGYKWGAPSQINGNAADVQAALAQGAKTITATYEQPYIKHAPIGPFVAVADVRGDGTATVWTHSANSQGLRAQIANTLSTPIEKVVVRWLDHAGQFGRTTFGGDGAEGDAAILSQLSGRPVRVQWTLQEDLAWSASSPGWVEDITCSLDDHGCVTGGPAQRLLLSAIE